MHVHFIQFYKTHRWMPCVSLREAICKFLDDIVCFSTYCMTRTVLSQRHAQTSSPETRRIPQMPPKPLRTPWDCTAWEVCQVWPWRVCVCMRPGESEESVIPWVWSKEHRARQIRLPQHALSISSGLCPWNIYKGFWIQQSVLGNSASPLPNITVFFLGVCCV